MWGFFIELVGYIYSIFYEIIYQFIEILIGVSNTEETIITFIDSPFNLVDVISMVVSTIVICFLLSFVLYSLYKLVMYIVRRFINVA